MSWYTHAKCKLTDFKDYDSTKSIEENQANVNALIDNITKSINDIWDIISAMIAIKPTVDDYSKIPEIILGIKEKHLTPLIELYKKRSQLCILSRLLDSWSYDEEWSGGDQNIRIYEVNHFSHTLINYALNEDIQENQKFIDNTIRDIISVIFGKFPDMRESEDYHDIPSYVRYYIDLYKEIINDTVFDSEECKLFLKYPVRDEADNDWKTLD